MSDAARPAAPTGRDASVGAAGPAGAGSQGEVGDDVRDDLVDDDHVDGVTVDDAPPMKGTGRPASAMPAPFAALHAQAREVLTSWEPPTSQQDEVRRRMLTTLDDDPTAMWRGHSRAHFTTSLVVVDADATRTALTLHAKAKRWFQFGGHLEAGDASPAAASLREGVEESGLADLRLLPGLLAVDIHPLGGAFGWCRSHLDLRHAAVAVGESLTVSSESDDVRWFDVDDLPDDVEPELKDAIAWACERVRSGG